MRPADPRQARLNRGLGYLDKGKSDGAKIVNRGHGLDRKGSSFTPRLSTNVTPTQQAVPGGDIGPVVTVLPFDDDDEAVALANNSNYGLAATGWTKDLGPRATAGHAAQGRKPWG